MCFVTFDDLNFSPAQCFHGSRKVAAGVSSVNEDLVYGIEFHCIGRNHTQGTISVLHICGSDIQSMRQTNRIYEGMEFDARYVFTCVIALVFCCIRVPDTLGIQDKQRWLVLSELTAADEKC